MTIAHPSTEEQDHHDHDERPHACNDGWVTIGQIVVDDETGEEAIEYALYLCRRCKAKPQEHLSSSPQRREESL